MQRPFSKTVFMLALLGVPTLWLAGVWIFDAVRVIAGCALLALLFAPRVRSWIAPDIGRGCIAIIAAWVVAYFSLLVAHMLARLHLGMQGIDFAVFSQVIDSIGRYGTPTGSLAAQAHLDNFLWHHFCPVLYAPGLLAAIGVSAPVAGVLVHAGGAAIGFGALFATARRTLGSTVASGIVVAALLSSSVRPELFWGLHDETFAIAFVGLALLAWLRGHFGVAAVAALFTGTCKESFFPFMAWFAILALVFHGEFHPPESIGRARWAFGPLIPLGLLATLAYFFLQPQLVGKSFDHFDKLASFDVLVSPRVLAEKLLYLGSVLIGSCGLGLLTKKGRIVLATALPLLGIVAISGYSEMWRPFGYYALIPSFIGYFAAVVSLDTLRVRVPALVSVPAVIFAVSLSLSFTANLPLRDVISAAAEDGFSPTHLAWIPPDADVVADPGAALALLRVGKLRRLYTVGQDSTPLPFDFVVFRPGGWEELPENLRLITTPCHPSGNWVVRCPR